MGLCEVVHFSLIRENIVKLPMSGAVLVFSHVDDLVLAMTQRGTAVD